MCVWAGTSQMNKIQKLPEGNKLIRCIGWTPNLSEGLPMQLGKSPRRPYLKRTAPQPFFKNLENILTHSPAVIVLFAVTNFQLVCLAKSKEAITLFCYISQEAEILKTMLVDHSSNPTLQDFLGLIFINNIWVFVQFPILVCQKGVMPNRVGMTETWHRGCAVPAPKAHSVLPGQTEHIPPGFHTHSSFTPYFWHALKLCIFLAISTPELEIFFLKDAKECVCVPTS